MHGTHLGERAFEVDPSEPLGLIETELPVPAELTELEIRGFEFSCRGDRVSGRVLSPRAPLKTQEGPLPLVLFQPDPHAPGTAVPTALEAACGWATAGCAVASIDLPLHASRSSEKLTELLMETISSATRGDTIPDSSAILWVEFTRQSVLELRRTLDVLANRDEIDASRIAFAGFGVGALVGALFCSIDDRVKAAVLAGTGGGFAPAPIDPTRYVSRLAPRPVVFINDEGGKSGAAPVSKATADALHQAAGGQSTVEWNAEGWLDSAWIFLKEAFLKETSLKETLLKEDFS